MRRRIDWRWSRTARYLIAPILILLGLAVAASGATPEPPRAPNPAPVRSDGARTVLITGANRGLGLEFSKQYHAAGWKVIATARQPDEAAELKALGEGVSIVPLDVTKPESVAALAAMPDRGSVSSPGRWAP
jgi:NADPH:quinone reductase-like Zn-dependent oxidoreductase